MNRQKYLDFPLEFNAICRFFEFFTTHELKLVTFKRSAAEQDISFYLNFDILSTILGINCVLAL